MYAAWFGRAHSALALSYRTLTCPADCVDCVGELVSVSVCARVGRVGKW